MNSSIYWDIKQQAKICVLRFHVGFLFGLLYNPEDGGDIFLQNVG
jgi:hypothetical protein